MVIRRKRIEAVIDDWKPDIIEIGSGYFLPRICCGIAEAREIPVVGFFHSDYPETLVRPIFKAIPSLAMSSVARAWSRIGRVYGRMSATFAASEAVLSKLRKAGLKRLFHVPLGVDHGIFDPSMRSEAFRLRMGASDGRKLILYLSRLASEKGTGLLLEAYPEFRQPDLAVMVIVGHGPMSRKVDRFASRYPEVTVLPYAKEVEAVSSMMASCDVFLSLGGFETFSLTTLEAMASGAVVLAPDSGGAGELVSLAGVIEPFRMGSASSLAAVAAETIRNMNGETPLRSRSFSMGYSWDRTFEIMREFYSRIIDAAGKSDLDSLEHGSGWWTS
jgi:alpha-1,6-mannosyltransferase